MMGTEEIRSAVRAAAELRPPRWPADQAPRDKIAALEEHLLTAAFHRAEVDEALHWLEHVIVSLQRDIENMTGWEPLLVGERQTRDSVLAAKRRADPATFEAGSEAKALRESCRRLIARFESEEKVMSRVYTLISGG